MTTLDKELNTAKQAALEAGKIIAKYYGKNLQVTHKSANQPLTEADLRANKIIKKIITKEFPNDGWLSEEDLDDEDRFSKKRVWIIDPLDGTKDFIHRIPEFAVSIALVEDEKPIVGVVYNPITKQIFTAVKNQGAFCNNEPIKVKTKIPNQQPHLLVSQSEYKRGEWKEYIKQFKLTPRGGCAYKMSLIAKGDADGTFTLRPKCEWDICAGHLIVEEAGGVVSLLDGKPILYNQASTFMDGLIYCNDRSVQKQILDIIEVKLKNF